MVLTALATSKPTTDLELAYPAMVGAKVSPWIDGAGGKKAGSTSTVAVSCCGTVCFLSSVLADPARHKAGYTSSKMSCKDGSLHRNSWPVQSRLDI